MLMPVERREPLTGIEGRCKGEMNRQRAKGRLNDTNRGEGSGAEEWSRRTKSNKSLNPTARQHASQHLSLRRRLKAARSRRVISGVRR